MEQLYNVSKDNNQDVIKALKQKNGLHQTFMFKDTDFKNKTINGIELDQGQFHGCDFTTSTFGGCKFTNCEFIKCKFNNASLLGVAFKNCTINQCDFTQTKLNDVYFNDDIITNNTFKNIQIVNNVTINGEDIIDEKQLTLLVNDNKSNIIADAVQNESEIKLEQILEEFKCFKKEDGGYTLTEGSTTLFIGEDEGGWRILVCFNKDGKIDDEEFLSSDLFNLNEEDDDGNEIFLSKQETADKLKDAILGIADSAQRRAKTDFIKKQIEEIKKKVEACKVTITQNIEHEEIFMNKMKISTIQQRLTTLENQINNLKQLILDGRLNENKI